MLEQPLTLPNGLSLPNRLAKAATTEALATEGAVSPALMNLYGRWSGGGAGLIVTGNVGIDPLHCVRPGDVMVLRDTPPARLADWAALIRSGGAKAVLQICHGGRQTQRFTNPHPLAPSAVPAVKTLKAFGTPRAATEEDLQDIAERFVQAALIGERAGFDGCQIHSAHGYLLSSFLTPSSNRRTDCWGGSIENRARLLLDIVREVKRRRASSRFAVTVKLNSGDFLHGGLTGADSLRVVELLAEEGIDLLEISGGTYEQGASFGHGVTPGNREAYFLDFARQARERMRTPLMLTGGFRTRRGMEQALEEGALDVVGLARAFCVEPGVGTRLFADREARIDLPSRWWGSRSLRGVGEMAYYSEQLQRMGRGLPPDRGMSQLAATVRHLFRDARTSRRQAKDQSVSFKAVVSLPPPAGSLRS